MFRASGWQSRWLGDVDEGDSRPHLLGRVTVHSRTTHENEPVGGFCSLACYFLHSDSDLRFKQIGVSFDVFNRRMHVATQPS